MTYLSVDDGMYRVLIWRVLWGLLVGKTYKQGKTRIISTFIASTHSN